MNGDREMSEQKLMLTGFWEGEGHCAIVRWG